MRGPMMKLLHQKTTAPILFSVLILSFLLLAGCIIEPAGEETGSLTLSVSRQAGTVIGSSSLAGSAVDADELVVDTIRVWMYRNGTEYSLGGSGFAEISGTSGTVSIEDIPEGDGYTVVVVLGAVDAETGVFQPVRYSVSSPFRVAGGRESEVATAEPDLIEFGLNYPVRGELVHSVVSVRNDGASTVVVASDESVRVLDSNGVAEVVGTDTGSIALGEIYSVTPGRDIGDYTRNTAYVNAENGIFPLIYQEGSLDLTSASEYVATSMENIDGDKVKDVTFSGAFTIAAEDGGGLVIFYQRKGGLGAGLASSAADIDWEWIDIGNSDEFEAFSETASPVRAQATSGLSVGYFSTTIGTFRLSDKLFDAGEIDPAELLDPDNQTTGFRFFAVAYPGSGRPLRINHMTLVDDDGDEQLIIGTPRGAFYFPTSVFDEGGGITNGLVNPARVETLGSVLNQRVVGMVSTEDYVAISTDEVLLVKSVSDLGGEPVLRLPVRAAVLGTPKSLFLENNDDVITLYVTGDNGLSVITIDEADIDIE